MGFLQQFLILSIGLGSCVLGKEIPPSGKIYKNPDPPARNSLRCGETINQNSGTLTYKRFEAVDVNERCVWTIRNPRDGPVTFNALSVGYIGSLSVTGIGRGGVKESWTVYSSGDQMTFYNSLVLLVTFQTDSRVANQTTFGFSMTFNDEWGEDTTPWYWTTWYDRDTTGGASGESKDIILAADSGYLKYPPTGRYGNNEFSTIIIAPSNNIVSETTSISLTYMEVDVENCCDFVDVFEFSAQMEPRWMFLGKIPGSQSLEFIRNKDLILLAFESDSSGVGEGFQIAYSSCS